MEARNEQEIEKPRKRNSELLTRTGTRHGSSGVPLTGRRIDHSPRTQYAA